MNIEKQRTEKLKQAKEILESLGMPKAQCNNRSAWVFLSLSNIRPQDPWKKASAPLLATFEIMQFIREYYGQDYKPNSRETIRRQTLHQFEQARLVDRNRDNPERATNSKDNNYSLNKPILEILKEYPEGKWKKKIKNHKKNLTPLKKLYAKSLNTMKIPITLLDDSKVMLSPGKHNQLHADILHEFCPRFVGKGGKLLYLGDTASSRDEGGKLMVLEKDFIESLGIPLTFHEKLPDIVIFNKKRNWLFLIEAVSSHGPVSPKRWFELEEMLSDCKISRIYVTAFPSLITFRKHITNIAWETEVWIADNPDHMIHFNGDRFIGPYK